MIDIQNKSDCCGCGGCVQRCPHGCITLKEDENGFLYPHVNQEACIDCHLCERVCPVLNAGEKRETQACFAATHPDDTIRTASSSGGIFSVFAHRVISDGGVVFGARFDEKWSVIHDYADTVDKVIAFRGSKYVQSVMGNSFEQAESFLKQGREVLFTGTPCQIAGLKRFLNKDYSNLVTVEIACHGVPSPGVWRDYLGMKDNSGAVTRVNFRDKSTGWRNYSVVIGNRSRPHDDDDYMACFLANYTMRPSCFTCPFKAGKSGADILIADLWGAEKIPGIEVDDNKGVSAVLTYSDCGRSFLERCEMNMNEVDVNSVLKRNRSIVESAVKPADYDAFWKKYGKCPMWTLRRYGTLTMSKLIIRAKRTVARLFRR